MAASFRTLIAFIVVVVVSLTEHSTAESDPEDEASSHPVILSLGQIAHLPSDTYLKVEHLGKRAFWDRANRDDESEFEHGSQSKRAFWDRAGMNGVDKKAFWDRAGVAGVDKKAFWERTPSKRAFWERTPSKRAFWERTPSKRAFWERTPSKRAFWERTPSKRAFWERNPSERSFSDLEMNSQGKRVFWDRGLDSNISEDIGKRAFWERGSVAGKRESPEGASSSFAESDQPDVVSSESKRAFWDRAMVNGLIDPRDKKAFFERGFSDRDTRADKSRSGNNNRRT